MATYFYDAQLRRYIAQFLRIFSDFHYRTDPDENGFSIESRVPIKYGDMSRMAASIFNNNTENVSMPIPAMAGYITDLKTDDARRSDPTLVTTIHASELELNEDGDGYTNKIGNRYSVDRYMPVPYIMEMKLDLITPNTSVKMQIAEQILTIFNPTLELQQNENPLDWSRVFQVVLKSVNWSNRNIPVGDNLDYDVMSFSFEVYIWITPPAKEKRQRIIKNIVTRIFETNEGWDYEGGDVEAQINITSENLKLEVAFDHNTSLYTGKLLNSDGSSSPNTTWESKMKKIGTITPGQSVIKLRLSDDLDDESGDVYGTIQNIDPNDPAKITFTIDQDSLPTVIEDSPITAIINPMITYPGNGINLGDNSITHRYMVLGQYDNNDPAISPNNSHWGGFTANNNDIIEYIDGDWQIIFNSQTETANQYCINLADGNHYRFDGTEWVYTLLGVYNPVYWSINDITPSQN